MAAIERAERDGAAVRRPFAALHMLGTIVATAARTGHITDVAATRACGAVGIGYDVLQQLSIQTIAPK